MRRFAQAKGVKYHQAMKHHMDEIRSLYYKGRSVPAKKVKAPKQPKVKKQPKPKPTKKPKLEDVEMSLEPLPKPPTIPSITTTTTAPSDISLPPIRQPKYSNWDLEVPEGWETKAPVVEAPELTHAPPLLQLQTDSKRAPDVIQLKTEPAFERYSVDEFEDVEPLDLGHLKRDVKGKPLTIGGPKANPFKQRRQQALNAKRAKLPRAKTEPLLLEAPLPYVKPEFKEAIEEFAELPPLEPGLKFLRPKKRKAEGDIKREEKALILSHEAPIEPSAPKKARAEELKPLSWKFIWNNLFTSQHRKRINKTMGKLDAKSLKLVGQIVPTVATMLGYTRQSKHFSNQQFNELMDASSRYAVQNGIKLTYVGSGYRGGNFWDDLKDVGNKIYDFGKDVVEG